MKKLFLLATFAFAFSYCAAVDAQVFNPVLSTNGQVFIPAGTFPTGFYGQALLFGFGGPSQFPPPPGNPLKTYVSVYNTDGKLIKRVVSNRVGQFYCYLKAGSYTLVASLPGQRRPPHDLRQYVPPDSSINSVAAPINVTVDTNQLTRVEINYNAPLN